MHLFDILGLAYLNSVVVMHLQAVNWCFRTGLPKSIVSMHLIDIIGTSYLNSMCSAAFN